VLISVDDGIPEPEAAVIEPLAEATDSPPVDEPPAGAVESPPVDEPPAGATESPPVDDVRPQSGNVEAEQPADTESPVAADDESSAAGGDRKHPVIDDSNQDTDIDPSVSPAAQDVDTAREDSESDSAKKTSTG
jgi:hypothetical protein